MSGELLSITDFMPPEEKCFEHLRQNRWSNGIICPKCNSTKVKKNGTKNNRQRYYCYGHNGTFSDTTGTIFYRSNIPLNYWYYFIFCYLQNQSTNHLSEVLRISYKTALGMTRKIQQCLIGACDTIKLNEIIEFDELYLSVGEKGSNVVDRPPRKRGLKLRGRGTMDKDKPPILGACDRKGHIRLRVFDHVTSENVFMFLLSIVFLLSNTLKIYTDEFSAYKFLEKTWIQYKAVNHSAGEYARGEVHNNTMEGYWSVYRPWMNTYRGVSKGYLPEYTSVFEFVENYRQDGWLTLLDKIIVFLLFEFHLKIYQIMNEMVKYICHILKIFLKDGKATLSYR